MSIRISLLLLALVTGCSALPRHTAARSTALARPAQPSREHEPRLLAALPALDAWLLQTLPNIRLPSLCIGIVAHNGLVYSRGFVRTDLVRGVSLPSETTRFRIGSITKTMTALAVLQLRDQGRLQLDTPAAKLLPELAALRYPSRDSAPITLRQLLTHTSGLPRVGGTQALLSETGQGVAEAELLSALAGLPLVSAPISTALPSYSNLGFAVLGAIVARVSGQSYQERLRQALLRPLGMAQTSFIVEPADARGWLEDAGGFRMADGANMGAFDAAGGAYSSVRDMARYLQAQLAAWPPRDDPEDGIVARSTLRESQLSLGLQRPGTRQVGAAWQSSNERTWLVEHDGATPDGYSAFVSFAPMRGLGVVVLSNGLSAGELEVVRLGRALLEHTLRLSAAPPSARETDALDRLLSLARAFTPARAHALFSERFLAEVPEPELRAVLAELASAGDCGDRTVAEPSDDGTTVVLTCSAGSWRAHMGFSHDREPRLDQLRLDKLSP